MQALTHRFHIQIFHCNRIISLCQFLTQLMVKILPLVPDLLMTDCNLFPLFFVIPAPLLTPGQFPLFPRKTHHCLSEISRILTPCSIRKDRHPTHRIINPQHFRFCFFSLLCLVLTDFILIKQTCIVFSGRLLTYGYRLQDIPLRYFPMFPDLHFLQFRKPDLSVSQTNIPIHHIRCIALPASMSGLEFRKTNSRIYKKILISLLQMKLHIRQCKGIYFFQPRIFFLIDCRSRLLHFLRCLIFLSLVIQHDIINKTAASKCFSKKFFLFFIRVNPEFIRFVQITFHPGFQYICELFQPVHLLLSKGRSSDSKMLPSRVFPVFQDVPSSAACCLRFYTH